MDYHMTPYELRHWDGANINWVARYVERVEGLPVLWLTARLSAKGGNRRSEQRRHGRWTSLRPLSTECPYSRS
jgi:hypothetical protein